MTTKNFKKGDVLFGEEPLVSAQFLWNAMYRYAACDQCLRPLETAQDNCRRLTGNVSLDLPFPENCDIKKEEHVRCSHCQVGPIPLIPIQCCFLSNKNMFSHILFANKSLFYNSQCHMMYRVWPFAKQDSSCF